MVRQLGRLAEHDLVNPGRGGADGPRPEPDNEGAQVSLRDAIEAFKAQGLPPNAVGTMDELQKHGMPARAFRSCNEPSVDGTVLGCPVWSACTMSYKGKSLAEGGGPRNHCWERIKSPAQGGGIVRNSQPCYWGVKQQEIVAENKEILQVIADEGEDYTTFTKVSAPVPSNIFRREMQEIKFTVPPFPRPGENKQMVQARMRAEATRRETQRVAKEGASQALGVAGASTPLDKRGPRGAKGGAKEGISKPDES